MKVLVTGAQGQLARALAEMGSTSGLDLHFVGRPQLDLAIPGSAARVIRDTTPDAVVNAAAYTAVDQAEREPDLAFAINAAGAGDVAGAAAEVGAPLIHLSSDYVFEGQATQPYREDAPTRPINVYGQSKLAGEERVRAANADHLILRTSWVFSPFGVNFVNTMLRLARARDEVRVVADQTGCPTSAESLALAIFEILHRWCGGQSTGRGQTYHLTGTGACSWADFAEEIFAVSGDLGGPSATVIPISTDEFPTAAARPRYSVLDCGKFASDFGVALPPWQSQVRRVVGRLTAAQ